MFIEPEIEPKLLAFDRVMAGVEVDSKIVSQIRERFIAEFPWINKTTQHEQIYQDILGGNGWGWGWHRLWRERLEALGSFPKAWSWTSHLRAHAIRETGSYDHRISLLASTIQQAGHIERMFMPKYIREWCYFMHPMPDEPAAIQQIERGLIAGYANAKGRAEPLPFYPGSRMSMSMGKLVGEHLTMGVCCRVRPRF
jgi:hypothetical protein